MDSDEIGFNIDDSVKGLLEAIERVPRKADHQLVADFKTSMLQTRSGHEGILCLMPSKRSEKNFIDHRLDADFHCLYPKGPQSTKGFFIQGIRPCGNPHRIDEARGKEGLDLSQIGNLI